MTSTLSMEIAIIKNCNKSNIIVPNASFGIQRMIKDNGWKDREFDILHECDILDLTPSGYATEYEIKISRSDFLAEKKKKHSHDSKFIKRLFYAVPEQMKGWALERLPNGAGLCYVCAKGNVHFIKNADIRDDYFKWTNEEMFKLAKLGTMRILGLKKAQNKLINEFANMCSQFDE